MLLLKNARILTMCGEPISRGNVLIDNKGKIASVGENIQAPQDAETIELDGYLLTPGLVDGHCHIGMMEEIIGAAGDDVNEMSDPLTPQLRAIDGINPRCVAFEEARAAGITTVVTGPGSANVMGGQFVAIKTAGVVVDDMILKDPVAMKIAFGENPKTSYGGQKHAPMTRMATAAMLREILYRAKEYCEEYDKARQENGKPPKFDAKLHAMMPLIHGEIPLKAHVHRVDDIFTALRIAKEFGLKITLDHCTEGNVVAERLAAEIKDALVGPSLGSRGKYELKEKSFKTPVRLYEAGMRVGIITDSPIIPLHYLPLCAGLAVKEGLPEMEAWKAITCNPAQIVGIGDRVGAIKEGMDADIVVFRGDPLRDVDARAVLTIINGEIVHNDLNRYNII